MLAVLAAGGRLWWRRGLPSTPLIQMFKQRENDRDIIRTDVVLSRGSGSGSGPGSGYMIQDGFGISVCVYACVCVCLCVFMCPCVWLYVCVLVGI